MRSRINIHAWLKCEYLGEGRFRYTCQTCSRSHVLDQRLPGGALPFGGHAGMIKRIMVDYRNQGQGMRGICPRCTKRARDERYPLSPRSR
jgi:hypothetical protein